MPSECKFSCVCVCIWMQSMLWNLEMAKMTHLLHVFFLNADEDIQQVTSVLLIAAPQSNNISHFYKLPFHLKQVIVSCYLSEKGIHCAIVFISAMKNCIYVVIVLTTIYSASNTWCVAMCCNMHLMMGKSCLLNKDSTIFICYTNCYWLHLKKKKKLTGAIQSLSELVEWISQVRFQ